MTQDAAVFAVFVSTSMPEADREEFLAQLRGLADISSPPQRSFAAEWLLFVAFMKQAGAIIGGGAAVLKLVNEIIAWRDRVRKQARTPDVRLERPGVPGLNLATATDDEIRAWLASVSDRPS